MSRRSRFTTAVGLASVLASCSDPGVISFRPDPSRTPDRMSSVVGSSPTSEEVGRPIPSVTPEETVIPPTVQESPRVLPTPSPRYTQAVDTAIMAGVASTYGPGYDGYFALPRSEGGAGKFVEVCNVDTHRCLKLVSNDVGPKESTDRVADLDVSSFEFLCDCDWTTGLQIVTVEFLD